MNQTLSPAGTGTVNAPASPLRSVEKFTRSIRPGDRPVGETGGGNRFIIPVRFDGDDVEARVARIERLLALELTARERQQAGQLAKQSLPPLEAIAEWVASHFGLTLAEIRADGRPGRITLPRQVAMFIQRATTGATVEQVGDYWNKHHGTVLHACQSISDRITTEPKFRAAVQQLQAEVSRLFNTHP